MTTVYNGDAIAFDVYQKMVIFSYVPERKFISFSMRYFLAFYDIISNGAFQYEFDRTDYLLDDDIVFQQ